MELQRHAIKISGHIPDNEMLTLMVQGLLKLKGEKNRCEVTVETLDPSGTPTTINQTIEAI